MAGLELSKSCRTIGVQVTEIAGVLYISVVKFPTSDVRCPIADLLVGLPPYFAKRPPEAFSLLQRCAYSGSGVREWL